MSITVELLARARREAGLTQRALAAAADIPQASVSRVERGQISPRASTIERWLDACGMTLAIVPSQAVQQTETAGQARVEPEATEPDEKLESDDLDWAPWLS